MNISGDPNLNNFITNDKNTYLEEAKNWLRQFKDQIDLVESEQNKIQANVLLLENSFEELCIVDWDFFSNNLNYLYKEYLQLRQTPETYEECQLLQNKLRIIKDKFLNEISRSRSNLYKESGSLNSNLNFEKVKEDVWSLIGWGFTILVGTYIFSSIFVSCSSFDTSSSYPKNRQEAAWYTTGYPKNQCGHSSRGTGCWYPVFIIYTDSNWNQIIRNCRDVPKAQTQDTARQRKQIQIASFNNESDAKGFAKFMDTYYDGHPWIGQKKCY